MNSSPEDAAIELELALPAGTVHWGPGQRVRILTRNGEPAQAGDGIAAELARLLSGSPLPPGVRRTVDAAPGTVVGHERGLGAGIDMTNWNVVVDERLIVKVVGRLGDGDRAVRVTRAVAERCPDVLPLLHGTLELDTPHGRTTVATVHQFHADSVDGWTWAVDEAGAAVAASQRSAWPRQLGRLVARVHAALADATAEATAGGSPGAGAIAAPLGATLPPPADGPPDATDAGALRLRARWGALAAVLAAAPALRAPPFAIHGDLHVGQVLRDATGTMRLIDFDGDPLGDFDPDAAEAAVDVAHLLVSLDLVGAIVAKRQGDHPAIRAWADHARHDLLAGYRDVSPHLAGAPLLDERRLPALEAQQLLREVAYAERYLPRWRYAADWAITHRFDPDPELEDPPWTPPDSPTT